MSNLFKNKLDVYNLGIVFGTFAPAHLGHYQMVMRAKKENEGCLVIVSGREGDRGDQIGLSVHKRFRYMRELFADDENVYVTYVDETDIPEYPDGWKPWLDLVLDEVKKATTDKLIRKRWYVGEEEYVAELEERAVGLVFLEDRNTLPISATMIRENPFKHWNYITRPFRRHFSTNVLVMGTASTGKTTLVRDLARSFGAPFTDEYARRYEEESNVRDEELVANDFHYLASGQFDNNKQTIQSPSNQGLFIADTDVMVTKVYAKYYLTEEEYKALEPTYNLMIAKQKWDMIIVVPPVTPYVNDNFRDMSYSDGTSRIAMHKMFMEEIKSNGLEDKVVLLNAPFDATDPLDKSGFYARYIQAREAIQTYISDHYGIDLP